MQALRHLPARAVVRLARHCHRHTHTLTLASQHQYYARASLASSQEPRASLASRQPPRLSMSTSASTGTVSASNLIERSIESKLLATFHPVYLQTINESHMHSVPRNSETHFKVIIVSDAFEGMKLLDRHRAVNSALAAELQGGVHALSITARTPQQWETEHGRKVEPSPNCMGGSKHDAAMQQKLRQSADAASAAPT